MANLADPDGDLGMFARLKRSAMANRPWERRRFWVAGVFVLMFLMSAPANPLGALLSIVVIFAIYRRWDAIARWNRARRSRGSDNGAAAPEPSSGSKTTIGLKPSSYVGKTLVGGEVGRYKARLSRFAFLLPWLWIAYLTTEMVVTNRRIVIKRGWLSRRTAELRLSTVESIGVHQGPLARMFGYGSVTLVGSGGTPQKFGFIANPLAFRRAITEALVAQEVSQGAAP